MFDGSISFDQYNGYNAQLYFSSITNGSGINNSYSTLNGLDGLTTGTVDYTIYDSEGHCSYYSDSISLTLDSCALISGFVYNEKNYNCLFDSTDAWFPGVTVQASGIGNVGVTDSSGFFSFFCASWHL